MGSVSLAVAAPAIIAAFAASLVEVVEAFTIVLAVGMTRGWRPAIAGTLSGLVFLAVLVVLLGPVLESIPLHLLQFVIGVLLLLFGLRWLRKAILRSAGVIPLHDEEAAFAKETEHLRAEASRHQRRQDWIAGIVAFKAIVLEGIEVVFIVIAVGAGRGLMGVASLGALAACIAVLALGAIVHRPLLRVPENALKFGVGIMLSAFGVFWTAEGLGLPWPGEDLAIPALVVAFLAVSLVNVATARRLFVGRVS